MRSIAEFLPAHVRALHPYVPGKPIEEVERELKVLAIKLASNENPLGPSPLAVAAARDYLANAHRYPDGQGFYLKQKLAERFDLPAEQVILGGGSTDIIEIVAQAFLQNGAEGMTSQGSFVMYYVAAQAAGARLVSVPLKNFAYDLEAMAERITGQTRVVFIANPNNPTGTYRRAGDIDRFLARIPEDALVVLDEAYFEYVDDPEYSHSLDYVRQGRRVLVLRTFSKVYGLAGLRIGYGLGPADVLEYLNCVRNPFNTSSVAQAAAMAALDDTGHVRRSLENNRREMLWLAGNFSELGLRYVPSVANFVLVDLARDADEMFQLLMREGVIVRPMKAAGFPTSVRISVGTHEENLRLVETLKRVCLPAGVLA